MRRRTVELWVVLACSASLLLVTQFWALPSTSAAAGQPVLSEGVSASGMHERSQQIGGTISWPAGTNANVGEVDAPSLQAVPRDILLRSRKADLPEQTIDCPTYAGPMVHTMRLNPLSTGVTYPSMADFCMPPVAVHAIFAPQTCRTEKSGDCGTANDARRAAGGT